MGRETFKKIGANFGMLLAAAIASKIWAFFLVQILAADKLRFLAAERFYLWWGILFIIITPIMFLFLQKIKETSDQS